MVEAEERYRQSQLRREAERLEQLNQAVEESLGMCLDQWGQTPHEYCIIRDKSQTPVLIFARWEFYTYHQSMYQVTVAAYFPGDGPYQHECLLHAEVTGNIAELVDITNSTVNRGLGTMVLGMAEEVCRKFGATKICGWLSEADLDHRDRQVRFYEKNGYTVRLGDKTGTIRKDLTIR